MLQSNLKHFIPCSLISLIRYILIVSNYRGFPGGSVVRNPPAKTGDVDSIPDLERSLGEENDNPLQYSCWKIAMDRGTCRLQSMGLQRVRNDLAIEQQNHLQSNNKLVMK